MKKVIVVGIIILSLFAISFTVSATFVLDETLTFGGYLDATAASSPSVFVLDETLTFGGYLNVTASAGNNIPTQSGESPVNDSIAIPVTPTLYVICIDNDNDAMDATWRSNSSGAWVTFGSTTSISNNTNISKSNSNFSATNTKYWWSVNLTDGTNWTNATYHFTTRNDFTPDAPASFSAVANNKTKITLTWTDHTYSDSTRVEWHTVADGSWNVGDHNLLYNDTAETTSQTGLTPSTARYYKAWSWNVSDALWSSGSTSDATTVANTVPTISSPNPSNNSFEQDLAFSWSCTIEDDDATFNWTIECSNGQSSSANDASNGSKSLSLSGLSYYTEYTTWVNATDPWDNITRNSYDFTTKNDTSFVLDETLTFGGFLDVTTSNPIISNIYPSNGSTSIVAYPHLRITVTDPSGLNMNVSWSTNATDTWIQTNTSVASGSTIYQRATFANTSETTYWWAIKVNNSNGEWTNATYHFTLDTYTWGEWSGWWVVYYTDCDEPLNLTSQANSSSMIYLNWTTGNNSDRTHIQYDPVSYPTAVSEGNLSYNDTGSNHEQTGLSHSTTYYFTAWSYSGTNVTMSYNSSTTSNTTNSDNNPPTQSGESPVNDSIDTSVTPTLYVICTDADSDTMNATWWSNSSGNWVQFAANTSISTGTNITQDNSNFSAYSTTYWWSANLSDGNGSWCNSTYHFTTKVNSVPTFSGEAPVNQSTGISVQPTVYVIVSDANGETMTCNFYTSINGVDWTWRQTNSTVSSGTNISYVYAQASGYSTKYYWKVTADDATDNVTSSEYEFTTEQILPPSSFNAVAHNTTQINITWVKGDGADKTTILRNATGYANYPDSPTNGTVIYNDTGTNYEDIGLAPGITYNYTAWSWNTALSNHSESNATNSATTNAPGEVIFSNFNLSIATRHTTSITNSPVDWINFTVTATNVASIQINITDAFSVIRTESILANKSGDNYWCNRTIPPSWGNGTYSVEIYASSASVSNGSSSNSFNMYPVCDVNLNNWTTATDITQIIGSNWGSNGVDRFCVEDINGNGWVTATDITYVIDPNRWGAVTKP